MLINTLPNNILSEVKVKIKGNNSFNVQSIFLSIMIMVFIGISASFAQQSKCISKAPHDAYLGSTYLTESQVIISHVPSYLWLRGCGPTALGMVVGYWDYSEYVNLIPGNAQTQTAEVDSVIANNSHYNDYSLPLDTYPNMLLDKSSIGGAHIRIASQIL